MLVRLILGFQNAFLALERIADWFALAGFTVARWSARASALWGCLAGALAVAPVSIALIILGAFGALILTGPVAITLLAFIRIAERFWFADASIADVIDAVFLVGSARCRAVAVALFTRVYCIVAA